MRDADRAGEGDSLAMQNDLLAIQNDSFATENQPRAHWILRVVDWWDRGGCDAVIFWMAVATLAGLIVAMIL